MEIKPDSARIRDKDLTTTKTSTIHKSLPPAPAISKQKESAHNLAMSALLPKLGPKFEADNQKILRSPQTRAATEVAQSFIGPVLHSKSNLSNRNITAF